MKKTTNKSFWENPNVIKTQNQIKTILADFELFMFTQAKKRQEGIRNIRNIKIFGCGTGREINEAVKFFQPDSVTASDIAENMIIKCNENLDLWGIKNIVTTKVGNAKDIEEPENTYDLVTFLNSILTYVPEKKDRLAIFKAANYILKPSGVVIGTVHNQIGTFKKTAYFKIKALFPFVPKDKIGARATGFQGFKFQGYYFNKKELYKELSSCGFSNIEIYSLEEFYQNIGVYYNRKKGYNNLIFIAQK